MALVALAACDFPTAPPIFETRFVIPGEVTTLSVAELLPPSITVSGNEFRLALDGAGIPARTLGQMCGPACLAVEGFNVPKPGFSVDIPLVIDFPGEVSSATVTAAAITLSLTHDLGFDPLQPSGAAENGYIAVTVRSGTRVLAQDTVRGTFPSGSTLTRTVQLAPGAVAGDLDLTLTLVSPAGGAAPEHWVTLRNQASLSGSVTPGTVTISEARVVVQGRQVNVTSVSLDLSDIDEGMADRVRSGAIVVDIGNPFDVSGVLTVTITGGSQGTITKQLQLSPGETRRRIELAGDEIRSLLGNEVTLSITGPVTAAGGMVTVRPGQVVTISTQLDLVVALGGSED